MRELIDFKRVREIGKLGREPTSADGAPTKSPEKRRAKKQLREGSAGDFSDRLQHGATTPNGFRERWALFWTNHFAVSGVKTVNAPFVGPFENEAIRPNVFGHFEDLLVASSTHTAMLHYLDQVESVGPSSAVGMSKGPTSKRNGLNENLAREILELHTIGIEAGYTQADVTEFARAMTGWGAGNDNDPPTRLGLFVFREHAHEPGARTIMGRRYPEGGYEQARAVLADLAASPHTAGHLAGKLARHFVADDPPPALVTRLSRTYMASGGNLSAVARSLIAAPEAWDPTARKFKTPYEFLVSTWRATGVTPLDLDDAGNVFTFMGQKPYAPPSPRGWPDEASVWCAPDALVKRMNWSESFAEGAGASRDPMQLASNVLGARLTSLVAKTIARAETRPEGLSILLMSPEFQRR